MRPWLTALALIPTLMAGPLAAADGRRPNVIVLMTDDQGMGDFACLGNPVLKTPNLDRLHAEGVRLTDFHVAPMCTPTRGQLMTGVDALRNGATSVTAGRAFLRPGLPTLPEIFARAGYRTGLFGKWHLGDNAPHRPVDRGFQKSVYHLGWGFTSAPEMTNTLFDGRLFEDGHPRPFAGYCTDVWFDRAMAWMKECKDQDQPFVCYLPTNAPHGPHVVAEEYSGPYQGKGPAAFFGMIANVDENLGRLEAFLREAGLRDDTVLVFLTDNGGTAGVPTFNAGLRGRKTMFYDGGHRVPCWIRWPKGGLRAGVEIDAPTQVQDLLPTLLDLCGLPAPEGARFDGTSLAGPLRDPSASVPERTLVVQYGQVPEKWDSAVIRGRWRLVNGKELYDVHADRAQEKDVAAGHPDVLARLRADYEAWWAGVAPGLKEYVATSIGSDRQPVVTLTSSDWQDIYADNAGHVRRAEGGPRGGPWNVAVERPGPYEIRLRRWPAETDWTLASPGDGLPEAKALPIAGASLSVAGREHSEAAGPDARDVAFRVDLPAGPSRLQGWFRDAQGRDLCGAYYAVVTPADRP